MPTTPIYALPYPAATDPADVPVDMQELAERIALVLGGALAAAPPASPFEGQLWAMSPTPGVVWMFRYNAGSASPYKWEFVGGPPWAKLDDTPSGGATGVWTQATPITAVPRSGDYLASFSIHTGTNVGPATLASCLWPTAGRLVSTETIAGNVNGDHALARPDIPLSGLAAASNVQLGVYGGALYSTQRRYLSVCPVRVS